MVQRHRGDDGQRRAVDHIGGIQPPAKTHLKQREIRRGARKREEGRAGGDLEKRDLIGAIGRHAFIQKCGQRGFRNQLPRQPDALMKPRQMRRGIGMNLCPPRLQPGADHRLRAALAIGARNMDHRRQGPLGVAQHRQKPMHPVHRQVDDLRMQRHHPLKDQIRAVHRAAHFASAATARSPGGGRSPLIAGERPINMRRTVINSSRISLR